MTTKEIAGRLVELCRKGQFDTVQNELFAKDAVSIEPHATPGFAKETKGVDAILKKGEKWNAMVEKVNSLTVSEPMLAGNSFAVSLGMDVIMERLPRLQHSFVIIKFGGQKVLFGFFVVPA